MVLELLVALEGLLHALCSVVVLLAHHIGGQDSARAVERVHRWVDAE